MKTVFLMNFLIAKHGNLNVFCYDWHCKSGVYDIYYLFMFALSRMHFCSSIVVRRRSFPKFMLGNDSAHTCSRSKFTSFSCIAPARSWHPATCNISERLSQLFSVYIKASRLLCHQPQSAYSGSLGDFMCRIAFSGLQLWFCVVLFHRKCSWSSWWCCLTAATGIFHLIIIWRRWKCVELCCSLHSGRRHWLALSLSFLPDGFNVSFSHHLISKAMNSSVVQSRAAAA
jgi:hypothetical protein